MQRKLELSLIENGLDYIQMSLNLLESQEERNYKYVILNLFSGISLVFKERVRQFNWMLLFDNVENANEADFLTGQFEGVKTHDLISRLEGVLDYDLHQEDKNLFLYLRDKRKLIEHFEFKENISTLKSITSKSISVILKFLAKNESEMNYSTEVAEKIKSIQKQSINLELFINHQTKVIEKKCNELKLEVVCCPECLNNSLPLKEDLECLFCFKNYSDPEEAASKYKSRVLRINSYLVMKGEQDDIQHYCPECTQYSLLHCGDHFVCFGCPSTYSFGYFSECVHCNDLKIFRYGETLCSTCWDTLIDKD